LISSRSSWRSWRPRASALGRPSRLPPRPPCRRHYGLRRPHNGGGRGRVTIVFATGCDKVDWQALLVGRQGPQYLQVSASASPSPAGVRPRPSSLRRHARRGLRRERREGRRRQPEALRLMLPEGREHLVRLLARRARSGARRRPVERGRRQHRRWCFQHVGIRLGGPPARRPARGAPLRSSGATSCDLPKRGCDRLRLGYDRRSGEWAWWA
jgi:hypothetical protein